MALVGALSIRASGVVITGMAPQGGDGASPSQDTVSIRDDTRIIRQVVTDCCHTRLNPLSPTKKSAMAGKTLRCLDCTSAELSLPLIGSLLDLRPGAAALSGERPAAPPSATQDLSITESAVSDRFSALKSMWITTTVK